MPGNLENRLQDLLPAENITAIYGSLTDARFSTPEVRAGVIQGELLPTCFASELRLIEISLTFTPHPFPPSQPSLPRHLFAFLNPPSSHPPAYDDTSKMYLYLPALILAILPLIPGAFTVSSRFLSLDPSMRTRELILAPPYSPTSTSEPSRTLSRTRRSTSPRRSTMLSSPAALSRPKGPPPRRLLTLTRAVQRVV